MSKVALSSPAHPSNSNQVISTDGRRAERIWEPRLPLDPVIERILTGICLKNGKEMCGFISNDEGVHYVKNAHSHPRHNFYMDQAEAAAALRDIYDEKGSSVMGIW